MMDLWPYVEKVPNNGKLEPNDDEQVPNAKKPMPNYDELVPNNKESNLIMIHKGIIETKQLFGGSGIPWCYPRLISDTRSR